MSVCCLRKVLAALKNAHTVCFESVLSSRSATNTHRAVICLLIEALQKNDHEILAFESCTIAQP